MRNESSHYFSRAMDAFAQFKAASDIAAVDVIIGSSLRSFGYERYFFATPHLNLGDTLERRRLLMNWPQHWCEQYECERLVEHDVIAASFRQSRKSFRWSDITVTSPASHRVMELAATDHQMAYGFCVPMYGLRGYEAGLSAAGREVDDSDKAHFAIELVAVYAYNRFSQIGVEPEARKLSPREREILSWIAAGKTTWDVSAILNISEDTVKKTTASAMRRLNVHTRAQAVAEAIRRNEFTP